VRPPLRHRSAVLLPLCPLPYRLHTQSAHNPAQPCMCALPPPHHKSEQPCAAMHVSLGPCLSSKFCCRHSVVLGAIAACAPRCVAASGYVHHVQCGWGPRSSREATAAADGPGRNAYALHRLDAGWPGRYANALHRLHTGGPALYAYALHRLDAGGPVCSANAPAPAAYRRARALGKCPAPVGCRRWSKLRRKVLALRPSLT